MKSGLARTGWIVCVGQNEIRVGEAEWMAVIAGCSEEIRGLLTVYVRPPRRGSVLATFAVRANDSGRESIVSSCVQFMRALG